MNPAATFVVLALAVAGTAALAQNPPASQVPPPPQTQGQINSLAAKHPDQPELMRPLSAAAQATPGRHAVKPAPHAAKPDHTTDGQKPQAR